MNQAPLFWVALCVGLLAVPSASLPVPPADDPAAPRALSQIAVEEAGKTVAPPKQKRRHLALKPEVRFFRRLDQLVERYGLDKELDEHKLDRYFRGLGRRVFKQLRARLIRPSHLDEPFRASQAEFRRVAQKYGIN